MIRTMRLTVNCSLLRPPGEIRGPQTLDPEVKIGITCERHAARMSPVLPPHFLPDILLIRDSFPLAFAVTSLQCGEKPIVLSMKIPRALPDFCYGMGESR